MVISLLALVIATSGSAMAASTLISGDKLIRKHSLSGNRVRDHTLSGRQINLAKLGTVPSASHASTADTANHVNSAGTATNANHASTADNATNANHAQSADTATDATTALNAQNLGGFPASAYQQACQVGSVAAELYVKGRATFSSTYTSSGTQDAFNCTGGVVEVKRTAIGVYDVHFGGLDSGAQLIAVGNQTVDPTGVQVNGGEITYKLVFDATLNGGGGGTVYQVRLDDASANTVDNEFSFALLSPQ
jgi:hypothetical protein